MERTVAKRDLSEDDYESTVSLGASGGMEATVGITKKMHGGEPVVGWLVCVKGPERGRDYRLRTGRNFVGRSWKMDVNIAEDLKISREKHASIVYDPVSNAFSLMPESSVSIALNGKYLLDATPLQEQDVIGMGDSEFVLIPYCKGEVRWT